MIRGGTTLLSLMLLQQSAYVRSECAVPGHKTQEPQDTTAEQTPSWFSVHKVADRVWRIDDHGGDNMYLVEGNDAALLIDAGTGVADLYACVRSLTALPVIVVNTHGHPDHCGGDFQFPEVYAHPAEFEAITAFCSAQVHRDAIERIQQESPELTALLFEPPDSVAIPVLLPIREGFEFNLGGRRLEVIETPGHTRGSVCLLDSANGLLFTGDNNNTVAWLFLEECTPLEQYLQTLQRLKKRSGEFTVLLPGHGDPLDTGFIDEQIACAQSILSEACTGEPYKTFVDYARACTCKRSTIAFNPEKLHIAR
ncbi:MAG: MBL fold metallo-hydrolase [Bacteroidetes bacterium]|nr:MBL fold metallo-hydrolase [Bacteroidota bacterium]